MTQPKHILSRVSKVKKAFSSLTLVAFLLTTLAPSTIFAKKSTSQILSNPAMIGMMVAVANLNHSMRVAAENPQDKWRVQNVRHAMGMIPVAMMGLAATFNDAKLVDSDLPVVMGMLGGFVDKNAADGYKKFLQNPSASAIPKLGADFPQSYIAKAEAESNQSIVGDENAAGKAADQGSKMSDASNASSDLKQFKNDDLLDLGSFVAQQKMNSDKPEANASITGNESAPKNNLSDKQLVDALDAPDASRGIASTAEVKSDFAPALLTPRDLDSDTADGKALEKSSDKKEDDNFFKNVGVSKEKKVKAAKKRKKLREGISFLPSVGKFFPVFAIVNELILNNAFAAAQDEEGQSGVGSGQILQGLAAIIAATAPIVAVAIQADADKQIAQITAQSQQQMTKIAADNAKYLSDQQKEITMFQTKVAVEVADKNNQFATDRLERQLAELRTQRDQNYQLEKEKRALETDYNNKRIDLANKQADQQLQLNKESLQAEIAKAGLSQGFGSKNNIPGSQKLTLTSATSSAGQVYSAGSRATGTNGAAAATKGTFSGPQLANNLAGASTSAAGGSLPSSTGFAKSTGRGIASSGSAQSHLVSQSGIPSLKGGTALGGTAQSITAMNGAVQTVNARGMTLYRKVLGKRGISGTSKLDIAQSKQGGSTKQIIAANSSLVYNPAPRGFLGTGRALAQPSSIRGISRPIRHINPYDGSVEQGDDGGELVGHSSEVSFSFSQ